MGKVIGIDLGTTNSCVAVMEGGRPTVIPNAEGANTTPSVVGFTKNGETIIGHPAKRQAVTNPENTVYSIKRFMGRLHKEVGSEEKFVTYNVVGNDSDPVKVKIKDDEFTPPEVSAKVLQNLKKTAEDFLGQEVKEAVITVPAYFNDAQRQATKDAGAIAGLDVLRIVNEPTAAALAFGLEKEQSGNFAIYDLGGGTFDISILEIADGVFEVKSTNGDTHLGGDNFDDVIITFLADEFQKENQIDLRLDKMALQRLKEAAEKAKIELSSTTQTSINLPFITADASGPKHLDTSITRAKFNQLIEDLAERSIGPCKAALEDSGLSISEIDGVILVGGSTRIPLVQEKVQAFFGKDANKGVNPDEVVALGAAIQGGILGGDESVKDILLLDVTPLSLGIETMGGIMTRLIEKNTTIPSKKSQIFSTAEDNQPTVSINVLQGEREMASANRTLGRFDLSDIPPAQRGVPQIEVSFDIDANGIVHVGAKDLATGKEQKIKIEASTGLSKEEIETMIKDAEANADEDKKLKEKVEAKNKAEQLIYGTEKSLKDLADKVEEEEKKNIESAIIVLKDAVKTDDTEAINKASEELSKVAQKLAEEAYKASGAGAEGADPNAAGGGCADGGCADGSCDTGADPNAKKDDGAVDADFEVVDEKDEK